jgi:hypothetical protein
VKTIPWEIEKDIMSIPEVLSVKFLKDVHSTTHIQIAAYSVMGIIMLTVAVAAIVAMAKLRIKMPTSRVPVPRAVRDAALTILCALLAGHVLLWPLLPAFLICVLLTTCLAVPIVALTFISDTLDKNRHKAVFGMLSILMVITFSAGTIGIYMAGRMTHSLHTPEPHPQVPIVTIVEKQTYKRPIPTRPPPGLPPGLSALESIQNAAAT